MEDRGHLPLVLVPTASELQSCQQLLGDQKSNHWQLAHCGLGVVAAALHTMNLIQKHRPSQVWLVGIAGALVGQLELGSAYEFHRFVCYGIGAGSGSNFRSATQLQWDRFGHTGWIGQPIEGTSEAPTSLTLLTSCAAACSSTDVDDRLACFPEALAEDMEAYSVVAACKLTGVPVRVIRGISNIAGQRDHSLWKIQPAMQSAVNLLLQLINEVG